MEANLISVVIPVYRVEQYLRRCVDSVLAQTYTRRSKSGVYSSLADVRSWV